MTNKTLQEQIEELEEIAIVKDNNSDRIIRAIDHGRAQAAKIALSIIKQLQEKNKKLRAENKELKELVAYYENKKIFKYHDK